MLSSSIPKLSLFLHYLHTSVFVWRLTNGSKKEGRQETGDSSVFSHCCHHLAPVHLYLPELDYYR